MSLASKVKPKVLYMGGSVLSNHVQSNYRFYSFRPIGIGKANWNPNNYSKETQTIVNELVTHFNNEDKDSIYDTMYAFLGNRDGIFSLNYGKAGSVINNMVIAYNKDHPENPLTEKEFLDYYGFDYTEKELAFLDKTNRGTIMSNISEILAPKIVMSKNKNSLVERSFFLHEKVNLSGQNYPEYSIGLFLDKTDISNSVVIIYDSDLKTTDEESLKLKLIDLRNSLDSKVITCNKDVFGMNVILVASHGDQNSEIRFNSEEIKTIVLFIKNSALKHPKHFENFDENDEKFKKFILTGESKYLNDSTFPVPQMYRPNEFYKLSHNSTKFEDTEVYRTIQKLNEKRDNVREKNFMLIEEVPDEVNNI